MKASNVLNGLIITKDLARDLAHEIRNLYHCIYTYRINYDEYIDEGDEILRSDDLKLRSLVKALCEARGDIFSSDREVACLYLVLKAEELIEED